MALPAVSTSSSPQRQSDVYHSDNSNEKPEELSAEDKGYVKRLKTVSIDLVFKDAGVQEACKALGQEIFDVYKKAASGSTETGKAAVLRIFNACSGIRQKLIAQAWCQIGDETWCWKQ